MKNNWIRFFADRIIKCYINRTCHFFTTTTSRSEGAHKVLKQQLRFFTEDLKLVIDKIEILLMNQRKNYAMKFDVVKMRMFFDFQIFLFRDLIFKVFSHVLRLIHKQYQLIQTSNYSTNCINAWRVILEFFCNHVIQKRMNFPIAMILFKNVHSHEHFIKFVSSVFSFIDFILLIKEPAVTKTRGRPMKSIIKSPSQSVLKDVGNLTNIESINNIEPVNNIEHQKKYLFNVILFSSKS